MRIQDPVQRSGNFIKGKIGENIVLRLLRDLGFQVFHNGYEVTHQALIALMAKKRIDPKQIRKYRVRADFTVLKEAENQQASLCFEAEVKFRFSGMIQRKGLEEYDDDVRFIFVDKENFWSSSKEDLFKPTLRDTNRVIVFNTLTALEDDGFFGFSADQKTLIHSYKRLISDYLPAPFPDKKHAGKKPSAAKTPKALPVNHGKEWTPELTEKLVEEYQHLIIRYSFDEAIALLAAQFDRSLVSIRKHLARQISFP